MRIAFVIYGSLDNVSGGFIYDRALVAALRSLGHTVDVRALPWRAYGRAVAGALAGTAVRALRLGAAGARAEAGAPPYDVVIEDELVHPSVFLASAEGRVRVALAHNLRCRQPREALAALKARVERRYLASVDGVLAVCGPTLADVRALAGDAIAGAVIHPGRDHVAPDVDETFVAARCREPGPLRLLHVAAVTPAKGLTRLLEALALGATFDFTLDIVGSLASSDTVRAIERQVARLGLAARARLHGELHGAALHAVFRRSQVLALPSDREAYSLACLEALGYGLPVLVTAAGGMSEMIQSGREGHLLDPADVVVWARALRALGANRETLGTMAAAALARYRAHTTWRATALAVVAFLEELLARAAAVTAADPSARSR